MSPNHSAAGLAPAIGKMYASEQYLIAYPTFKDFSNAVKAHLHRYYNYATTYTNNELDMTEVGYRAKLQPQSMANFIIELRAAR